MGKPCEIKNCEYLYTLRVLTLNGILYLCDNHFQKGLWYGVIKETNGDGTPFIETPKTTSECIYNEYGCDCE